MKKINYNSILLRLKFVINHKYFFPTLLLLLIFIKLYLVSGQSVFSIGYAGHDDRLFINHAQSLLRGEWLGEYTNLTLAKGMFYPVFIALSFLSGIPLLVTQQLIYILGCLILIIAIKPLYKNRLSLLIIFILLLFNPITYADSASTRIIREGIYNSLCLIVIAFTIGYFLRTKKTFKVQLLWMLGLGTFLSFVWLTREEGIWLLPMIVIVLLVPYFNDLSRIIKRQKPKNNLIKKALISLIPFFVLILFTSGVSSINLIKYGEFDIVELKSNNFVNAYGALSRIEHENWVPGVPIPKDVREKAYSVSPKFNELQIFLDGDIGNKWVNTTIGDIPGGWFLWALRDAASAAGYYSTANTSADFFGEVATEINSACDNQKLKCIPGERNSMTPPYRSEYNKPMINAIKSSNKYVMSFSGISTLPSKSMGDRLSYDVFADMTRSPISALETEENPLLFQSSLNTRLNIILDKILILYKFVAPFALILSLLSLLFIFYNSIKNRVSRKFLLVIFSLLSIYISRILIISYIEVSSFGAINVLYLSPLYTIFILILTLLLSYFVELTFPKIINILKNRS